MAGEFEIQYEATEEAKRLLLEVLNGEEIDTYRLQLGTYLRSGRPLGIRHGVHHHRQHR